LELQIKIIPEEIPIKQADLPCPLQVILDEKRGDFTFQATGQSHQTVTFLGEYILVHSRAVIETLQVTTANQFHQIAIALLIFGQESEVIGCSLSLLFPFPKAGGGSYVYLAANDRLYSPLFGLSIEIYGAKKISVIGESESPHIESVGLINQLRNGASSIQKAVITVDVKMTKLFHEGLFSNQSKKAGIPILFALVCLHSPKARIRPLLPACQISYKMILTVSNLLSFDEEWA